jgi:hypothetical protein
VLKFRLRRKGVDPIIVHITELTSEITDKLLIYNVEGWWLSPVEGTRLENRFRKIGTY